MKKRGVDGDIKRNAGKKRGFNSRISHVEPRRSSEMLSMWQMYSRVSGSGIYGYHAQSSYAFGAAGISRRGAKLQSDLDLRDLRDLLVQMSA